ncbi:hypothetical protein [Candidatus Formimonas warabiya]|uniref:DUF1868 domain-containing protein n=1 Tax=Formimonas warabiya TaxID=1761012 RepID=A0A3G1KWR5_FORW1|nr:hypothetical protein [Candidatus Formimonas warabiya]ATW26645.1 hypothetical protein DCMF_19490 [Candidatus Formimonas warabiya]
MEMNYEDYCRHADQMVEEKFICTAAGELGPLGKFHKREDGAWEPVPYAGYSIITPTFLEDRANASFYQALCPMQAAFRHMISSVEVVEAPLGALHMTVARLISGDVFVRRLKDSREEELLLALNRLFSARMSTGPLMYQVKGWSFFPQGVLAAVVSPLTRADFGPLLAFRDGVYADKALCDLGVERKRGFDGHISLYYIEEHLPPAQKKILADAVREINKKFFAHPLPFHVTRAEVRRFHDFTGYCRSAAWPAYVF